MNTRILVLNIKSNEYTTFFDARSTVMFLARTGHLYNKQLVISHGEKARIVIKIDPVDLEKNINKIIRELMA